MLSNLWSRSSGVHVAEKVLDTTKWDTATLVAHLKSKGAEIRVVQSAKRHVERGVM